MSTSIKIDAFCPVGIGGTKGIDTTHLKIFVGGLLSHHTSKDLYDIFIQYGAIRESVVIPDRFRVRSRCYGFVTFVSHESVSDVFRKCPIETKNGNKLTVVLASSNTKPRRAHFNVRHGTSGHKALPMVKEEENENEIGIYSDPSLFRTANIQPIAPASFTINKNKKNKTSSKLRRSRRDLWPNEDIKKDYVNLKKIDIKKDGKTKKTRSINKKLWRLVAVNNDKETKKGKETTTTTTTMMKASAATVDVVINDENDDMNDDILSVCSRRWTPIKYIKSTSNGNNNNNNFDSGRISNGYSYSQSQPSQIYYTDKTEKEKESIIMKQDDECNKLVLISPKRQRISSGNSPYSPPKVRHSNNDHFEDDTMSFLSLFSMQNQPPTDSITRIIINNNNNYNINNMNNMNEGVDNDMNHLRYQFKQKMEEKVYGNVQHTMNQSQSQQSLHSVRSQQSQQSAFPINPISNQNQNQTQNQNYYNYNHSEMNGMNNMSNTNVACNMNQTNPHYQSNPNNQNYQIAQMAQINQQNQQIAQMTQTNQMSQMSQANAMSQYQNVQTNPWSPYQPCFASSNVYDTSSYGTSGNMNGMTMTPLNAYNMSNILPSSVPRTNHSLSVPVSASRSASMGGTQTSNPQYVAYQSYINLETANIANIAYQLNQ